jgi:hypothetical protein
MSPSTDPAGEWIKPPGFRADCARASDQLFRAWRAEVEARHMPPDLVGAATVLAMLDMVEWLMERDPHTARVCAAAVCAAMHEMKQR